MAPGVRRRRRTVSRTANVVYGVDDGFVCNVASDLEEFACQKFCDWMKSTDSIGWCLTIGVIFPAVDEGEGANLLALKKSSIND